MYQTEHINEKEKKKIPIFLPVLYMHCKKTEKKSTTTRTNYNLLDP